MKIAILLLASALTLRAAEPLTVAVMPFDSSDEKLRGQGPEVAELLSAHLGTKPDLWLLERAEIDKILGEQTLGLSGLADPAAAAKVGQILGTKAIVTGRLIKTGERTVVVAKVMSTETSRVFGETANADKDLSPPAKELADKVAAILTTQRAAFAPAVVTHAERLARLGETINGNNRSVLVTIEERDLGQTVVDPAAQTEFEKSLLELGFTIWNPTGEAAQPAFIVTGEAFSQLGARRGQLVSARGRVEIKVTDASGNVVAVDRETASAVDTAEATAGKTALQNAAFTLLERIAPKLVSTPPNI